MIRELSWPEETGASFPWLSSDPFGCRILGALNSYSGKLSFCRLWFQEESELVLGLLDDVLLVTGENLRILSCEQVEEMRAFVSFCGARTMVCPSWMAPFLPGKKKTEGRILTRGRMLAPEEAAVSDASEGEWKIQELYHVLEACRSRWFPVPPFEPFYLDISHRLRHGTAQAAVFKENGRMVAVAFSSAYTTDMAILSAVAVLPSFRRKGLGKEVVFRLFGKLPSRTVCVYRADPENKEFYASLGFQEQGGFAELQLSG